MFTGIIQATGVVQRVEARGKARFITIKTDPKIARCVPEGGSVSVDGVCLTRLILGRAQGLALTFELLDSTLKRTTLGTLRVGDIVNIEPAMLLGQPIGGHLISGHVDDVGRVRKVDAKRRTQYVVIEAPKKLMRYLVPQGSVVVNGVSLTIVAVGNTGRLSLGRAQGLASRYRSWFSIALTSYTLEHTNLCEIKAGATVNIEVDMLAKYLEKFFDSRIKY